MPTTLESKETILEFEYGAITLWGILFQGISSYLRKVLPRIKPHSLNVSIKCSVCPVQLSVAPTN